MAARAADGAEDLLAREAARRRPLFARDPAVEVGATLGDDIEGHVRVLQSAELGALPAVDPGLVRAQEDRVAAPRHRVDLAVEARHPERVQDVGGRRDHAHRRAHGDVDLVRGRDPLLRIADRPEPLLADDVDRHLRAARRRLRGRTQGREDVDEERDQHDRRHERARDEHGRVAVLAPVDPVEPAAPLEQRDQHEQRDDADDDRRADEHHPPERRDRVGRAAVGRERRLLAAAAGEREREHPHGRSPETDPTHALLDFRRSTRKNAGRREP